MLKKNRIKPKGTLLWNKKNFVAQDSVMDPLKITENNFYQHSQRGLIIQCSKLPKSKITKNIKLKYAAPTLEYLVDLLGLDT